MHAHLLTNQIWEQIWSFYVTWCNFKTSKEFDRWCLIKFSIERCPNVIDSSDRRYWFSAIMINKWINEDDVMKGRALSLPVVYFWCSVRCGVSHTDWWTVMYLQSLRFNSRESIFQTPASRFQESLMCVFIHDGRSCTQTGVDFTPSIKWIKHITFFVLHHTGY